MLFQKNLPVWERALRLCIGLFMLISPFFLSMTSTIQWLVMVTGVIVACTGFIGFCPMCAIAGRKLNRPD
ncbi:MAG: DUF2892 domain-containing protein [Neisseriaceae bacterium]|nr:DUF2892 domain-containing protein [Neisseriaceae bacterium]